MSELILLNMENWAREVLLTDRPVLVDFQAPWCDPEVFCNDELAEFQEEWKNFARVGCLDALHFRGAVSQYHVQEFPTLVLFQSGHEVKAFTGPSRVGRLREWLLTPEAMEEPCSGTGVENADETGV